MDVINYSVFVVTTFGNSCGTSVCTTVIPARGEMHANEIAAQIEASNVPDSYLRSKATVVGS